MRESDEIYNAMLEMATEIAIVELNALWCDKKNHEMRVLLAKIWKNCNYNKKSFSRVLKPVLLRDDPVYDPVLWDRVIDIIINNVNMDLNKTEIKVEDVL